VLSAAANKPTGVARALGNMEVVSKPFDFLELLAKIRPFVGPIDIRSDLTN
jgi:DNA-binding response OmpR family regulator